ncbi:hypothetical protein ACFL2H_10605 [Planctomycetota bacterium]
MGISVLLTAELLDVIELVDIKEGRGARFEMLGARIYWIGKWVLGWRFAFYSKR